LYYFNTSNEPFPSASIGKLPIALYVFSQRIFRMNLINLKMKGFWQLQGFLS